MPALEGLPCLDRHVRAIPPRTHQADGAVVAPPQGGIGQGRGVLVGVERALRHEPVECNLSDRIRRAVPMVRRLKTPSQFSIAPAAFRPSPILLASSLRFRVYAGATMG